MSRKYVVTRAEMATPTTLLLSLLVVRGQRPVEYEPGQYATISFKHRGRWTPVRCFSIASSPHDRGRLQFSIRVDGNFTSTAAASLRQGDTVRVDGPFGGFVFDPVKHHGVVLLAGGIGIAPFMSMIRYASDFGMTNEIILLYGCQSQDDAVFADELLELEKRNPHFHVVFSVGHGEMDRFMYHRAVQGRLRQELLDGIFAQVYSQQTFFICGPPPFMDSMLATLKARRVPRKQILTESFNQIAPGKHAWYAEPTQIYLVSALVALGLMAVVLDQDVAKTEAKLAANGVVQPDGSVIVGPNGRENDVNQMLNNLQSGDGGTTTVDPQTGEPVYNDSGNSGSSDGNYSNGGGFSPSPSTSPGSSPSPSPSGSPSPSSGTTPPPATRPGSPTPAPSPNPTPLPRPTPNPTPLPQPTPTPTPAPTPTPTPPPPPPTPTPTPPPPPSRPPPPPPPPPSGGS